MTNVSDAEGDRFYWPNGIRWDEGCEGWYRRSLLQLALELLKEDWHVVADGVVRLAVLVRPRFVIRHEDRTYDDAEEAWQGRTTGEWVIDSKRFGAALDGLAHGAWAHAVEERRAQMDESRFPTLDGWLDAAGAGRLQASGPPEPNGVALANGPARERLWAHVLRLWTWPRLCADCRAEFRPSRRGGVRCDSCLAGRRVRKATRRDDAVGVAQ